MAFEVRILGLRELRAELDEIHGKVDPELGKALSKAAVPVKEDARRRASGYSAATVSGIRVRRRGTMVRVEQGQRKTTGFHKSYGVFQQTHFFDPALAANQEEVIEAARDAIDELTARANTPL